MAANCVLRHETFLDDFVGPQFSPEDALKSPLCESVPGDIALSVSLLVKYSNKAATRISG